MDVTGFELAGRLDQQVIDSALLRGNPLGDPHRRPVWVYLPPGYDGSEQRYPVTYVLLGFGGTLPLWRNRMPFRRPVPELIDRIFARGEAPPMILVFVDAMTKYGGSQYVDSAGTGRYHSYLCDEVVNWVDTRYRTIADRRHRAIAGKSSGGLGAMITPMLRPDLFGALATHSGDALSEAQYIPHFLHAVRHLRAYDGDIFRWWHDFSTRVAFTKPEDERLLELLGVSACFSPGPDGTPELPFDPHTGQLRADVWERWLRWDPVRMAPAHASTLRSLRAIWIDAGTSDEWFLDLGAEALHRSLRVAGVSDERMHFELFDGGHRAVEYRQPLALAWLAHQLSA
ncbi:putative esterase [Kribbella flavida DSM 17836]|uniref:Putative esterase n=1 Tax=Kribbella flavida (strain DSM 17836 / JCM 10339 / NBRC 14399) TaxID=479435 RepID=D2PXK0_KRIFD|nr:alpha/beta hydrolase-fold protein [Kribbella flavida]ADB31642.1 putative esterase [Kribbella flavida DSM 17836]